MTNNTKQSQGGQAMSDTPRTDDDLWSFPGPMKVAGGIKVYVRSQTARQLERELNAANAKIKELEEWKRSALEVEREWNANAIATMLGGKLGESQREVIQREVPKLLARIKRLEEAGDALYENSDPTRWDLPEANARKLKEQEAWRKAKEAKP